MTDLLARLDAEETRLLTELAEVRAAKATLRRVCGLADPPHGPVGLPAEPTPVPPARDATPQEPPAGKAAARPSPAANEPGKRAGRKPDAERPLLIARALLAGPKTSGELMAATGMPAATFTREIRQGADRGLWRKQGNKMSPWELTPEGRAAAG